MQKTDSERCTVVGSPRTPMVRPEAAPIVRYTPSMVDILPPETPYLPEHVPPSTVALRATYTDRSKGFLLATLPLATVAGVVAFIAGIALFAVPILSWSALLLFFGMFCLSYTVAYLAHTFVSPDGVPFLQAWAVYRLTREEQKHRHARYWTAREDTRWDGDA